MGEVWIISSSRDLAGQAKRAERHSPLALAEPEPETRDGARTPHIPRADAPQSGPIGLSTSPIPAIVTCQKNNEGNTADTSSPPF